MRRSFLLLRLGVMVLVFGGGSAAFLVTKERAFARASESATGVVQRVESEGRARRLVVELDTPGVSGRHTVRFALWSPLEPAPGERIAVRVHPGTGEVRRDGWASLYAESLLVAGGSLFLFLIAAFAVTRRGPARAGPPPPAC